MNLRRDVREANLKQWRAQTPAIIEWPLVWLKRNAHNPDTYRIAAKAAKAGDGMTVKKIARRVIARQS